MLKRTKDNAGLLMPGGKRRFLASSSRALTSCDSACLEDMDAELLDDNSQDDMAEEGVVCYGAVSLKLIL